MNESDERSVNFNGMLHRSWIHFTQKLNCFAILPDFDFACDKQAKFVKIRLVVKKDMVLHKWPLVFAHAI